MANDERILQINIEEEMKTAYIDYSMSVIISRALPDVRDGLKPVQRRVIYGMDKLGLSAGRPYKKAARIVGEVLGKYHPHGDSSVYEAMVRMAQDWSLRYPLVDGQGNFGSMDGDSPAAMRYTEARLARIAGELVSELDEEIVAFQPNFDDSETEPSVMPSKVPNLLINGASGIAVGMATNMLPHNLTEVINGIIAYIDDRDISIAKLATHVIAPDFPTGGIIYGYDGVMKAFETGRGRVVVRGKASIETIPHSNRERIVVTEIPYQVNKALLVQKVADLVNEKRIEGISEIRDESDRKGMSIIFELKRDANAQVVLNQLYNYTPLQSSFGVNNVCLVNGRPRLLNLKELITYFVDFRHEIVIKRTELDLRKAEARAHILEGLLKALDHLDEIIALIRASQTPDEARAGLMSRFDFTQIQATEILNMRLQRLTGLEREKLKEEYAEVMAKIDYYRSVLASEELRMSIIKNELSEVRDKYGDKRRTEVVFSDSDISIEELIEKEQVVVAISHLGYIKRTSLAEYREQNRGGRGSRGGATRDEDFIEHVFVGSTHDYLLIFTQLGKCYWQKVYQIPEGSKVSKGRPIQNIINLPSEDKAVAYLTVEDLANTEKLNSHYIIFCTRNGTVKKTVLEAFSRPRQNGIMAITINDGDSLIDVRLTNGNSDIIIASKYGRAVRFSETKVNPMGRTAAGVRGITLSDEPGDEVVGLICTDMTIENNTSTILSVSEKGYGKRSAVDEYRLTNRGGKGVITMNVTEKTGHLIAIKEIQENDGLMIINKSGITIRMSTDKISVQGRNTQGVRLINLTEGDEIAGVAKIAATSGNGEEEQETEVK
ncbi:DNA gyrase subunit A [Sphingobacteriales bacterium UPWRP_1]|nr:DNA gyrase subunit A [Sphingobacteriales bacterium TSM_CSM]PSJ78222.1 DNA gyrase subunit A [Sphingobacteriales bacterium UPWRP_1]